MIKMVLTYNKETERYNDFNCGECFKIKVNDKWKQVRIEIDAKRLYLIDEDNFTCRSKNLEGCEIEN